MKGVTWGQCYIGLIVRGNDLDLQAPKAAARRSNDVDLLAVKGVNGGQCYVEKGSYWGPVLCKAAYRRE